MLISFKDVSETTLARTANKADVHAGARARAWTLFAVLFVAAQLLFAAHAGAAPDDLLDHSPTSCAFCLAGAVADDPSELSVAAAAPVAILGAARRPVAAEIVASGALGGAQPRGPPSC
ncbi:MAG: hypothetical protein HXY21_09200 [Parvularculaceae bacterium]|nr:hypothetical protein [Parvularculaceae bacterium]